MAGHAVAQGRFTHQALLMADAIVLFAVVPVTIAALTDSFSDGL